MTSVCDCDILSCSILGLETVALNVFKVYCSIVMVSPLHKAVYCENELGGGSFALVRHASFNATSTATFDKHLFFSASFG